MNMVEHKQVRVKVNACVDEKIAPVVEALSKIPEIVTEYSCEDNRTNIDEGIPRAYITFHYGEKYKNYKALVETCDKLSRAIACHPHVELFVRWREGQHIGLLEFNTKDAYWLTQSINNFLESQFLP